MVNINIVVEGHSRGMNACEKKLILQKLMGYVNVFVRCSLFDIYVKGGSKKIWHEMISFVCD
jgi:hypothetical protein